jgi:hypothetical protein
MADLEQTRKDFINFYKIIDVTDDPTPVEYERREKEMKTRLKRIIEESMDYIDTKFDIYIETQGSWNEAIGEIIEFFKKNGFERVKTYNKEGFYWKEAMGLSVKDFNRADFFRFFDNIYKLDKLDYQFRDSKRKLTITNNREIKLEPIESKPL